MHYSPSELARMLLVESVSLLLVDDDLILRERLARAFRSRGYDVRSAANYEEALTLARQESPELAVVDLRMPGRSGLELIRDLKAIDAETRIVILTGYGSIATAVEATKLGAAYYLPKPADADEILAAFARGDGPALEPGSVEFAPPSIERVKWEHINRVLADCGGNLSEAARRLDMHRRTLQRMLQKFPPRS
jgi:two-component system response regulator RegA